MGVPSGFVVLYGMLSVRDGLQGVRLASPVVMPEKLSPIVLETLLRLEKEVFEVVILFLRSISFRCHLGTTLLEIMGSRESDIIKRL